MKVAANPVAEVLDQQGWLLSGTFLRVWNGLKGRIADIQERRRTPFSHPEAEARGCSSHKYQRCD